MELNARNGPKMTEEQITAYLARIGISSPVPLTLEGLGKLQMAHRLTVPLKTWILWLDAPYPWSCPICMIKLFGAARAVCARN